MTVLRRVACVGLVLATGRCVVLQTNESRYFQSAEGRATQAEIRQHLGPPWRTASTSAGEPQWVYEVREEEPGSRWTSNGLWCDEYVLTFDAQGV
jgi:hypothetical protein